MNFIANGIIHTTFHQTNNTVVNNNHLRIRNYNRKRDEQGSCALGLLRTIDHMQNTKMAQISIRPADGI